MNATQELINQLLKGADVKSLLLRELGITHNSDGSITNASPVNLQDKQSQAETLGLPIEDTSVNSPVTSKEKLLIDMYREFTKKDDGKALASEFSKFSRFIQSEVAKCNAVVS